MQVTFRRININFIWAFLYNILAIAIASGIFYAVPGPRVYIPPAFAGSFLPRLSPLQLHLALVIICGMNVGLSEILSSIPVLFFSYHLQRYTVPPSIARIKQQLAEHTAAVVAARLATAAASSVPTPVSSASQQPMMITVAA